MMARTIGLKLGFLFLAFCLILMLQSASGQNVNNDGNLTYDSLPVGGVYHITTGLIPTGGFTLRTTWNIIDGFLKMISPAGPPYDLIAEAIQGNLDTSQLQSSISELQGNFLGFVILFILGLIFTLIFIVFLLIFCCCRCCGNCGGKMEQKNSSKFELMRYIYSAILLVTLFFITFGAITALAVSEYTSSQVANLPDTIDNNIDDMLTYVNNTLEELYFLVDDQLSWTMDQVSNDLTGLGDLVGVPVREGLRPTVGAAIDAVYPLDQYIKDTLNAMVTVNTTQDELEDLYNALDAELTEFVANLTSACTSCVCCSGFDYSGLILNADYRDIQVTPVFLGTFPQQAVTVAIGELENVVNQNLTAAADVGSENFENIPNTLTNTTAEVVNDLVGTLGGLQDTIYETVNASTSQLSSANAAAEDLRGTLDPILDQAVQYDSYRDLAMSLAFSFILFVAVLFFIGVVVGLIGHFVNKRPPSSRSGIESCGGCTIMIAAVLAGILVVPFMLISSFTFVIGGPIDRLVCDNLLSKELFTQTIDQPGVLGEGYFLGEALFQDNTIPLTVTGMLEACEQNQGIYTAFQLENLLNISQFTDIDAFLGDVDSQFGNITGDFSGVNILTGDTRDILIEFRDSSADTIPWDSYIDELAKNVTDDVSNDPNDLSVLAANMDTAAASISNSGDRATIEGLADELRDIQTNFMAPLITKKDLLATQIDTLTNYTDGIDTVVNDTIDAADTAQDYLDNNAATLVQANIVGYQDRVLGYPYQFADYIDDQIRNEVGRCLPVYNLYSSSVNTFCVGFIQAFNGFWYCLGLCTFMFIIAFAFGIKSSKYYRRMKHDVGFEHEQYGLPLVENKVAPEQYP